MTQTRSLLTTFRTFDIAICPTADMFADIATEALTPALQYSILQRVCGDSSELQRQVSRRRGAFDDGGPPTEQANYVYDQPASSDIATISTTTVSVSSDNLPHICVCQASM